MCGDRSVAFLKAIVLLDVVQIIPADDHRSLHLHLGDDTRQDSPADVNIPCERTFLVDVISILGLSREQLDY